MHRESGYDSEVDPIVKYIKSIRWTQFGKVWKAIHTRVHTPWNCHELPIDGKATVYGQSVTDACIGWEATESTLDGLHAILVYVGGWTMMDHAYVVNLVQSVAAEAIGSDEAIAMDNALMEVGLDSLGAITFRNKLQQNK